MRPADTPGPATAAWSEAALVDLTIRLVHELGNQPANQPASQPANEPANEPANQPANPPTNEPAPPEMGPLSGRVADGREGVLRLSTTPPQRAWSVPLLVTPAVEAWLFAWPAGLVTPAHGHRRGAEAVTVVEGSLSEECLDPTIWTTGRRTTWRAGASTLFPSGHVHLLGAAGDRPALAVHAWSRPAGSADRAAGRLALGRGAAAPGRGRGRGRGRAEPVRVDAGRRGHGCLAGQPVHGAADLVHVRDRVAG
jgi:quercetin dioxygenase-like cupin family protein